MLQISINIWILQAKYKVDDPAGYDFDIIVWQNYRYQWKGLLESYE